MKAHNYKALTVATGIAMGMVFGMTASQAGDRHGFDTERLKMDRGITGQVDPSRLDESVNESRTTSRSVEERLSEGMDGAAVSSGGFQDSSMHLTQASTSAWWQSRMSDCEANNGRWDQDSMSCVYPHRECQEMGFEWNNGSCEVPERALPSSVIEGGPGTIVSYYSISGFIGSRYFTYRGSDLDGDSYCATATPYYPNISYLTYGSCRGTTGVKKSPNGWLGYCPKGGEPIQISGSSQLGVSTDDRSRWTGLCVEQ